MSLSYKSSLFAPKKEQRYKTKQGKKALLSKKNVLHSSIQSILLQKRHPCASQKKGSYTVEAAIVLPLALTFFIFLLFFLQVETITYKMQSTLDETGQEIAALASYKKDISVSQMVLWHKAKMIKEKIPTSYIQGDALGIDYQGSELDGNHVHIETRYVLVCPIKLLGVLSWQIRQTADSRKWIGWDPKEEGEQQSYVYVTKNGSVYHRSRFCMYLNPTIEGVRRSDIEKRRNLSGGKYKTCRGCGAKKNKTTTVYITSYGDVYHCSLRCVGLKRTIYRKPLSQVQDKKACSKCGKE